MTLGEIGNFSQEKFLENLLMEEEYSWDFLQLLVYNGRSPRKSQLSHPACSRWLLPFLD
jgi:hypothetical protein